MRELLLGLNWLGIQVNPEQGRAKGPTGICTENLIPPRHLSGLPMKKTLYSRRI